MYQQGLGDCFLMRIETAKEDFFDVLIDCGIYKSSPDAGEVMNVVVDDLIETTKDPKHPKGHLDLLIVTHEHWDHISGFAQALGKFDEMAIDAVWQAWTEDANEPVAKELLQKFPKTKNRLVAAMNRMHESDAENPHLKEAFEVMAFFGVDKLGVADDDYEKIRKMLAKKQATRYLSPREVVPLGETGVKAFVLGPPKDVRQIAKDDPGKKDGYHKQKTAFFDSVSVALGGVESQLEPNRKPDPDDDDLVYDPFGRRLRIPVDQARQIDFFRNYAFPDEPNHPEAFRSIDDLAAETLGQLALRLDSHINNTSLVIAFQLPSGDVLLFPGDAQAGNWKSWADPENPLPFPDQGTNSLELLAKTVFYKVAHHGSHNATPKTYGLMQMTNPRLRAAVPVDHTVAIKAGYGEMPLVEIIEALGQQAGENVVQCDIENTQGDFVYSETSFTVGQFKNDRPLWVETSFELT
jgi:hypothetical protein